jgi:predicted Ser/Thr protein kinase
VERIGRYEVVRELGHGAMGRVFLARDPSLERQVALKLLATASGGARARFHEEAKALASLNHPGIVTIYEVSDHEGQDFIAMEYLAGKTLRELLAAKPRRDDLVAICGKVALAVDAAHRAGILHRDIKPENIVITDDGVVKVVDFGVARRMNVSDRPTPRTMDTPVDLRVDELIEAFTTMRVIVPDGNQTTLTPGTQTVFGTPAYIAPEVLAGGVSTERSDVYSLGVTLYECIARHRPYEKSSLVELMATVIDGRERPERLADPLGELADRMLAQDPAARPALADVAAALAAQPAARARVPRWLIAAGAGVVVAGGLASWQLLRGHHHEPPAAVPGLAVEPIALIWPSGNIPGGADDAVANSLATVAAATGAVRVLGPEEMFGVLRLPRMQSGQIQRTLSPSQLATAAHDLAVTSVVRGKIEERDGKFHAHLEVTPIAGGAPVVIEREAPTAELATLELDLAELVARTVNSDARLVRSSNTGLARALTARGLQSIKDAAWFDGKIYLEQAVIVDTKLFDAWNTLSLAREWQFEPEDRVKDAIVHARELAPDEIARQLLTGIDQYLDRDFRGALATLAPLEVKLATLADQQKHDLFYYLGETHWHAGRMKQGVDYFRRVLDIDPRFAPAAIHPAEYALCRRNGADARAYSYLQGSHRDDSVEFAVGHYEALAEHGNEEWRIPAMIVLGRKPPALPENGVIGKGAYDLAVALEAGDRVAADAASARVWQYVDSFGDKPLVPSDYYLLQMFGEVAIVAGRVDDMKKLVSHLAARSQDRAVGGYPRMLLLAAPLLRDKKLVIHDYYTDRMSKLADASEAELAGKRAKAAAILHELVADPSPFWDFPERAALIRNLRALGRTKEANAVCADTMRPAQFRYAFMQVRQLCKHR